MSSLPKQSAMRSELLPHLALDINTTHAAAHLTTTAATINKSRKRKPNHAYLQLRYPLNVKRKKVRDDELEAIKAFIRDACPTKSGSTNKNYLWTTKDSLYHAYAASTPQPRTYCVFMEVFKSMHVGIKGCSWGAFDCPLCAQLKDAHVIRQPNDVLRLQMHSELIRIQIEAYKKHKAEVNHDQLLLIIDFAKIYLDVASEHVVECFVIVAMRRVVDHITTCFFDFLCADPASRTNDFFYVTHVFDYLFTHRTIDLLQHRRNLIIWSDGGPHHFKTNFHINYLRMLAIDAGIHIQHHFFPSYHGHSLADGHAGTLKSAFRRSQIKVEGDRLKSLQFIQGPKNVHELKSELQPKLRNTTIIPFDSIPRDARRKTKDIKIAHLKEMHRFTFDPRGHCTASTCSDQTGQAGIMFF